MFCRQIKSFCRQTRLFGGQNKSFCRQIKSFGGQTRLFCRQNKLFGGQTRLFCRQNKPHYRHDTLTRQPVRRPRVPSRKAGRVLRAQTGKDALGSSRTRRPCCPAPIRRYIITICGVKTGLFCQKNKFVCRQNKSVCQQTKPVCQQTKSVCQQNKPSFRHDTLTRPPKSGARLPSSAAWIVGGAQTGKNPLSSPRPGRPH